MFKVYIQGVQKFQGNISDSINMISRLYEDSIYEEYGAISDDDIDRVDRYIMDIENIMENMENIQEYQRGILKIVKVDMVEYQKNNASKVKDIKRILKRYQKSKRYTFLKANDIIKITMAIRDVFDMDLLDIKEFQNVMNAIYKTNSIEINEYGWNEIDIKNILEFDNFYIRFI